MLIGSTVEELYRNAPDYDLEHRDYKDDIPFLETLCLELAKGGRVLDLCCGTGRETIPLARLAAETDFNIIGVDITKEMLDRCREKLACEKLEVQKRLELLLKDIRTGNFKEATFMGREGNSDLALVPFNSFLHLLTTEDQMKALRNIHRHLVPGGHFLADIFCPNAVRLAQALGPTWIREERVVKDRENDICLVRQATAQYDQTTQIQNIRYYYQIYQLEKEGKLLRAYRSSFSLRMIFPAEWRLLLTQSGFEIVEEWGSYDRDPFEQQSGSTKSPKMLFLARKS